MVRVVGTPATWCDGRTSNLPAWMAGSSGHTGTSNGPTAGAAAAAAETPMANSHGSLTWARTAASRGADNRPAWMSRDTDRSSAGGAAEGGAAEGGAAATTTAAVAAVTAVVATGATARHEGSAQRKPQGPARWERVLGMHTAAPGALWAAWDRRLCAGAALLATCISLQLRVLVGRTQVGG